MEKSLLILKFVFNLNEILLNITNTIDLINYVSYNEVKYLNLS
jgi:hypothetical protein